MEEQGFARKVIDPYTVDGEWLWLLNRMCGHVECGYTELRARIDFPATMGKLRRYKMGIHLFHDASVYTITFSGRKLERALYELSNGKNISR
jgi:hypothetical protein